MRRFLRGLLIFLLGGIAGAALGFAAGIFFFPYLFPPPPANEQLSDLIRTPAQSQPAQAQAPGQAPAQVQPQPLAQGTFIHANPKDPVHWGRGSVKVFNNLVFLEPNFEVGPGPKYHVYLVPNANIRNEAGVKGSMFIDLGRLRAFKGSQGYQIPAGVDLAKFPSVVIWCEAFGVLISPADLTAAR
jgi:hypothetical protein